MLKAFSVTETAKCYVGKNKVIGPKRITFNMELEKVNAKQRIQTPTFFKFSTNFHSQTKNFFLLSVNVWRNLLWSEISTLKTSGRKELLKKSFWTPIKITDLTVAHILRIHFKSLKKKKWHTHTTGLKNKHLCRAVPKTVFPGAWVFAFYWEFWFWLHKNNSMTVLSLKR